jgi:hydroxypyruvate reductase
MIRNVPGLIKGSPRTQQARRIVLKILNGALAAVDPHVLIPKALTLENHALSVANTQIQLDELNGVYVIGAGKATGRMAEALETMLHEHITGGCIIVPTLTVNDYSSDFMNILSGGHPTPTKASITATQQLINFIDDIPHNALVLSVFSGGGSALLTRPPPSITLQDLQRTTHILLQSGATISEINTLRKHISQVKGGQLAKHIHPRQHIGLLLSDVPGDQLDVIASGPTLPDPTTFTDAVSILNAYQLWEQIPSSVQDHLNLGIQGKIQETPKPPNPIFASSVHQVIGTNRDACQKALAQANQDPFTARILTTDCQGEAREVGAKLGQLAQQLITQAAAQIVIVGSETTVTVHDEGKGGRNTEIVAATLPYLQGNEGLVIASLATDGIDGPTDAAGAVADGASLQRTQSLRLSYEQYLDTHATYHLFHELEDLFFTGPTHTNVRDITVILWMGQNQ